MPAQPAARMAAPRPHGSWVDREQRDSASAKSSNAAPPSNTDVELFSRSRQLDLSHRHARLHTKNYHEGAQTIAGGNQERMLVCPLLPGRDGGARSRTCYTQACENDWTARRERAVRPFRGGYQRTTTVRRRTGQQHGRSVRS